MIFHKYIHLYTIEYILSKRLRQDYFVRLLLRQQIFAPFAEMPFRDKIVIWSFVSKKSFCSSQNA